MASFAQCELTESCRKVRKAWRPEVSSGFAREDEQALGRQFDVALHNVKDLMEA